MENGLYKKSVPPVNRRNASVNKQGLQGDYLYETSCFLLFLICRAAR